MVKILLNSLGRYFKIAIILILTILIFIAYLRYEHMKQIINNQHLKIENLKVEIKQTKENEKIECFENNIVKQKQKILKEISNEKKESFDSNATTIYF